MKKIKTTALIRNIEWHHNSYYGNPSYCVWFECDGDILYGKTASNAQCGYTINNFLDKLTNITYHITKNNNIIIDYVSGVK